MSTSTYIVFGAPILGIVIGIAALFFLRIAGGWAEQERENAIREAELKEKNSSND